MILKELGQILPDSLKYLNLDLEIFPNGLKIFLDNFKHVGLNKLLVRNNNDKNIDVTFNLLKEFVKNNKIKNLAYLVNNNFNPHNLEHRKLEMLVSEAQSFVIMKRYNDLVVRISDFDIVY